MVFLLVLLLLLLLLLLPLLLLFVTLQDPRICYLRRSSRLLPLDDRRRRLLGDRRAQEREDAAGLAGERVLVLGPRGIGDALQQTFDVCRLDVPVKQPPPRQGGDADDDKDEPQTHHEGAIAPASAAGSRSPVLSLIAVANRLRTKPVNARTVPDRLKAASRRSSAVDLFEASLRQISATATLRSRFGDRSDV